MPWLITNEIRRLVTWPFIRLYLLMTGVNYTGGWKVFGKPVIQRHRGSSISLASGVMMRSFKSSNPLVPRNPVVLATRTAGASIKVGRECGFTGAVMVAATKIEIGDRVQVGANASIVDTDFHPIHPDERLEDFNAGASRPIHIGDDVFIGMNSLVLKGVTIGEGSVIGAGSVVVDDIPANSVVGGNPATTLS